MQHNKNHALVYEDEFRSLPLMSAHLPMIEEYLDALHGMVANALIQYSRVFAFRVDFRLPVSVEADPIHRGNETMSRCIASFKAKIRHNRDVAEMRLEYAHPSSVRYFWVREEGDYGRVHYHAVILLNGNAFHRLGDYQSQGNLASRVCEAWASALGITMEDARGLTHFPENPAYMLHRNNQQSIADFFHRASYLCKVNTKHYGFGHHGYGASRR